MERLQTLRIASFSGSWVRLGRALETRSSLSAEGSLKSDDRLATAAYLEGWKQGSARCLVNFSRRLLAAPIEGEPLGTRAVGLELTWRAAEHGTTGAMGSLAKLYGRFGGDPLAWGNFMARDEKVSAGWIFLAESSGEDLEIVKGLQKRLLAEAPTSRREAERWVADATRPSPWLATDDPFEDAVIATPSARERVFLLLDERAPLSLAEIEGILRRQGLASTAPSAGFRESGFLDWYAMGKAFDPKERTIQGTTKDRSRALFCYLRAVEAGNLKGLRRVGKAALAAGSESTAALGEAILFRAALLGDRESQMAMASFLDSIAHAPSRFARAWAYVHRPARPFTATRDPMPSSLDQAMSWIQDGLRSRLEGAAPYSVFQQQPVSGEWLWRTLVAPPLSTAERRDLVEQCGSYPFELARQLDPVVTRKRPPQGRQKSRRLASAAYLLARERGIRRADRFLGKLLVRGEVSSDRGVRMLGVDLLIAGALWGDGPANAHLEEIYGQAAPDAPSYGLVTADPLAAAGWSARGGGVRTQEAREQFELKFGVDLPKDLADVQALIGRTLRSRQRAQREALGTRER
jgi:hypothetical protein